MVGAPIVSETAVANVIARAKSRQLDRPDIHKKVRSVKRGAAYPQDVVDMVTDLKFHVTELSIRQLSTLVGIGCKGIRNILDSTVPDERWSEEDNPASCAAELVALRFHYAGRKYEDETNFLGAVENPDFDEVINLPVLFTAPTLRDPYRIADQSHTIKRPITLATRPFDVAA